MAQNSTQKAASSARGSRTFQLFARAGFAVNGLLHILMGTIAIGVAFGAGGEADQSGALGSLSTTTGGILVLWTVVVGLAALGTWYFFEALVARAADATRKWAHRAVHLGKSATYLALAVTAFTFASGGSTDSSADTRNFTAALLELPGGIVLLVLIAIGVIVIGGYFVKKGVSRGFETDISPPRVGLGRALISLGIGGYVAKGIALIIVGVLFAIAAFTLRAQEATGLDGALKALAGLPFGTAILVIVGAGLIAYGVYCFGRARFARL